MLTISITIFLTSFIWSLIVFRKKIFSLLKRSKFILSEVQTYRNLGNKQLQIFSSFPKRMFMLQASQLAKNEVLDEEGIWQKFTDALVAANAKFIKIAGDQKITPINSISGDTYLRQMFFCDRFSWYRNNFRLGGYSHNGNPWHVVNYDLKTTLKNKVSLMELTKYIKMLPCMERNLYKFIIKCNKEKVQALKKKQLFFKKIASSVNQVIGNYKLSS